jgi:hypothetical protein
MKTDKEIFGQYENREGNIWPVCRTMRKDLGVRSPVRKKNLCKDQSGKNLAALSLIMKEFVCKETDNDRFGCRSLTRFVKVRFQYGA